MSKKYPIINPKANCVIGMYVKELIGMDHPIAGIRLTSKNDAYLCYQQAVPLKAAIKSILARIQYLFGEDIPEELVMATVYSVYAESTALKVRKTPIDDMPIEEKPIARPPVPHRPIDIHKEYVSFWLKHQRFIRESEGADTSKTKKQHYPKLSFKANGIAGGYMEIPKDVTINEILAKAMRVVMGSNIRSYIYLSEYEIIKIMPPWL